MRNIMTVDVEDWFQVGAFEGVIKRTGWSRLEHRVARNCDIILQIFDDAGVKATFFTLGWVAEHYPRLIRRIADAGHEIASHGWDHRRVFMMTQDEFAADLARSHQAIEQAAAMSVTGYRAPSFSIDHRCAWAHQTLAAQGYAYSSSVAPIRHDHYGWPESPRFAYQPVSGSALREVPVTTAHLLGRRVAAGGGGFFRLMPYALFRSLVTQVNCVDRQPAIFYFHPWEIDPGQPRVSGAPFKSRLRHYLNLDRMEGKLRRLLADFQWGRMDHVMMTPPAFVAA
ncbi:XrtA system polysaccharide deacetylase [Aquisediminimonas sediminicola]|uniref:XrtA system polysaccharide deacetylase n=1 Tax=Alteraquisediminimonas sediminicola TaxID=2676787 RepID=UPI001C8D1C37|nr:XrtA system polysaccharide deacetylase [Aquisediminimonas sediminicola]